MKIGAVMMVIVLLGLWAAIVRSKPR